MTVENTVGISMIFAGCRLHIRFDKKKIFQRMKKMQLMNFNNGHFNDPTGALL